MAHCVFSHGLLLPLLLEILNFWHVVEDHGDEADVVADGLELSMESVPADVVQEVVESLAEAPHLVDHREDDGQHAGGDLGAATQREVDLGKKTVRRFFFFFYKLSFF